MKKTIWTILALMLATAALADNNKNKDNNGNHYGQIKNNPVQVSPQPKSVPEPAILGLVAAGALAVGVSAWTRRRRK